MSFHRVNSLTWNGSLKHRPHSKILATYDDSEPKNMSLVRITKPLLGLQLATCCIPKILLHVSKTANTLFITHICYTFRHRTKSSSNFALQNCCSRVQLKWDGTRWRTGGVVKGKLANGVGMLYSSHYLETWCIQHYYRWCAHLGCQ